MEPGPDRSRSAVVTGGGTGIGFACAATLLGAGFDVTIAGRRADVLADAAERLTAGAGAARIDTVVADLALPDEPARVIDGHVARFGGIDAVVAGAGAYEGARIVELTAATWDATMDTHVRGAVLTAGAAVRHMTAAGRGRIVLISSVNGFHSEPETVAYSAAKTAIVSVARTLAVELGSSGVSANAIAPGWVRSPMTDEYLDASTPERMRAVNPMGRAGTAEEIAAVVRFLVLDAPAFLTGATILVDGGQTAMAPLP